MNNTVLIPKHNILKIDRHIKGQLCSIRLGFAYTITAAAIKSSVNVN